jgi:hypothetical protein
MAVANRTFASADRPGERASAMPKPRNLFASFAIVLSSFFAATACAGQLDGTITYRTAAMNAPAPLGSALVSVYRSPSSSAAVTRTNNAGAYRFSNLAAGQYVIFVEKDGRRIYQGRVTITDQNRRFDIQL